MQSPEKARSIAEALVERGIAAGATAADAIYVADRSSSVQVRLGELEGVGRSEGEEIGLRLFIGNRSATAASSDLAEETLAALVGVKSSARRLGDRAPAGIALFYAIAIAFWGAAVWSVRPDWLALVTLIPAALHLANQALRADPRDGGLALRLFRSNRTCGLLIFLGMLVVGLSSR